MKKLTPTLLGGCLLVAAAALFSTPTQAQYNGFMSVQKGDEAGDVNGYLSPDREFASFGHPAINSDGAMSFRATLTKSKTAGIYGTNCTGIWMGDINGTYLLVRTGDPDTFGYNFTALSDPTAVGNNQVAFYGTALINGTKSSGIFSAQYGLGNTYAEALVGDPAPGTFYGETYKSFPAFALSEGGDVVWMATLTGPAPLNQAIYVNGTKLIQKGDVFPGTQKTVTALDFLPVVAKSGGQSRSFGYAPIMQTHYLIYRATFSDKTSGIYALSH